VLVGSNEYYPFFDAPVVSTEEYRQVAPVKSAAAVAPADMEEAEPEAVSEELREEDRVEFEEALPRAVGDDWAADAPASRAAEAVEDIEVPAEDVEAPVAEDVAEQPDEIEVEDLSDNAEDVTEQPEIAEPSDTDPADEAEPSGEADSQDEPEDEGISSGAALRRKLSQRSDEQPEQAAPEAPEAESTGLFKKLFRRKRA
jgi:hypothetical protein